MKTNSELLKESFNTQHLNEYQISLLNKIDQIDNRDLVLSEFISLITEIPEDKLTEDFDSRFEDHNYSPKQVRALADFYQIWKDDEAIISRSDNKISFNDHTEEWMMNYVTDMVQEISQRGSVVNFLPSYYGFMNGEKTTEIRKNKPKVLAAFNIQEDTWSEFYDSFTENTESHGISAEILFEDYGMFIMRYEAEFKEFFPFKRK